MIGITVHVQSLHQAYTDAHELHVYNTILIKTHE